MTGLVVLVAALVVAVAVGLVWRARSGKFRDVEVASEPPPAPVAPAENPDGTVPVAGARDLGGRHMVSGAKISPRVAERLGVLLDGSARATLLQFSSAFCAPCRGTRQVLAEVAQQVEGVRHVEVDAESHLDEVNAMQVRKTPTVFVLDADGVVVKRASGLPRKADVVAALGEVL